MANFIPGAGLSLNNGAAAWTPGAPQAANIPSDPQPVQATNLASRNGQVFSVQPSEVSLFEPAAAAPYDRYTSQLQPLPNPETLSPADTAGWAHLLGSTSYPRSLPALGVPDALHKHFAALSLLTERQVPADSPLYKGIPQKYFSIYPLDSPNTDSSQSGSFGYPSVLYKALSKDGYPLALRRFDNVRCSHSIAQAASTAWKRVKHPAVVKLHSCYTQGRAVFFVHEYLPGAVSLRDRYITPHADPATANPQQVSDRIMWSYISQLVAVLRNIHGTSMACRCLTPAHVLRTSGGRLRVSCVGVVDVLEFEARKHLADLQREDVRDLGRLILALGTRAIIPPATDVAGMQKAAAIFQTHYPAELYNFAVACLSKPLSIFDVCGLMGHHVFEELDVVQSVADGYEAQLSREFESGRSLRLLLKLGFVNERPELGIDRQWAETGDRYVLKLFRDFVFHQTDGEGNPVLDLGHVVTSLNKLDAGDGEKICLASRDGQALLVVSYADVSRCLEGAYEELCIKNVSRGQHGEQQQQQQQQQYSAQQY